MIVGICKLDLLISGCRSLKEKRSVLRKIKDGTFARFKLTVSEVDDHDLWQRTKMGFALVGPDKKFIESLMGKTINYIESHAQILDQMTEFLNY